MYVKTKSKSFINIENNQKYIKLDSEIFNSLNKTSQTDQLIEKLLDNLIYRKHLKEDSNEMNINDLFLITIQIDLNCFNSLLSSFPNGDIKFNLHFNPFISRESVHLKINIFENFSKKQDFNDLKTALCYFNHRINSSVSQAKFKITNISLKQINDLLINNLNFEKVSIMTINMFIQQRHGLLTDCICLTKNDDNLNGLDYKIQTSLIILSKYIIQLNFKLNLICNLLSFAIV